MQKPRGLALVASLFCAMSVLMIVTVMFTTMQADFRNTALSSDKIHNRYVAKAACAEVVASISTNSMSSYLEGTSAPNLKHYDPPVTIRFEPDIWYAHVVHVIADCQGERAYRVLRQKSAGDAFVFSAGENGRGNINFYRASREALKSGRTSGVWWSTLAPPPTTVFAPGGTPSSFSGNPTKNFAADFRGNFYAALSGDEGFALYKYAGSDAWERLPPRPQANFSTGGVTVGGGNYSHSSGEETLTFDAAKDGEDLWFVQNVAPGTALDNGASFVQRFDTDDEAWNVLEMPRDYTVSSDGYFQVEDMVVGSAGRAYILTKPTDTGGPALLSYDGGNWSRVPAPDASFYAPDGRITAGGALTPESLAIGGNNELFVTSPTQYPNWYAVSKLESGQWSMALDEGAGVMTDLSHRNFATGDNYKPLSVDSAGFTVVGDESLTFQGNTAQGFAALDEVDENSPAGAEVRDKIGGGLRAASNRSGYSTTLEY